MQPVGLRKSHRTNRLILSLCLVLGLTGGVPASAQASSVDLSHPIAAAQQLSQRIRPVWLDAVVAAEDRNFRDRARAGSTITVFAARLIETEQRPNLPRTKASANIMQTTLRLGTLASHDEILCLVLQRAYFGQNAFGHDMAARVFFAKGADELTVPEIASLIALIKAPQPFIENRDRALDRRNFILREMHKVGAIPDADLDIALTAPLGWRF